jgi:hypothetical protein
MVMWNGTKDQIKKNLAPLENSYELWHKNGFVLIALSLQH